MNISFGNQVYPAKVWYPEDGVIAGKFAYDTETTISEDPTVTQDYVVGTAFDGIRVYFIRRQELTAFWVMHANCIAYLHTASFDLEVTTKSCGFDFNPMIEASLLRDISIYFRLLACAKAGEVPRKYNLGLMCKELLRVELDKKGEVRKGFGEFYHDGLVDYTLMSATYLVYAARDAIATYQLAELLEPECRRIHQLHGLRHADGNHAPSMPWGILGHDVQLRGDIALRAIEHYGLAINPDTVSQVDLDLRTRIETCKSILAEYGYAVGREGNQAILNQLIEEREGIFNVNIPCTEKTKRKSTTASDLAPLARDEFITAYIKSKSLTKVQKSYIAHLKSPSNRIHPHYDLMHRTGRTSSRSPTIQTLPRDAGVRECIVSSLDHVLLTCDYSMLELCTMAQITYRLYGKSTMRDLINQGVDLHRYVAGMILRKSPELVTKDERQKAKAVSFGLPGGMGIDGLRAYTFDNYGVALTTDEAKHWRSAWLGLFPEMRRYLDQGDNLSRLGNTLDLETYPRTYPSFDVKRAAMIVMRIAGGAISTSTGRAFSKAELDWAWAQIIDSRAGQIKTYAKDIVVRRGSKELQYAITPGYVASIPTGRIRTNCVFTESKNWPFQSLAADGAKLALYGLIRAGFRVIAFIHDEVLVEIPECDDYRAAAEGISGIMIAAMRQLCPDVEIRTEYAVMKRWSKSAKATYDTAGHLIPYESSEELPATK